MITEKNKRIFIQHPVVTWFLVCLMIGSFLFGKNVLAYTGDYNKVDGSLLGPAEWNNLINDFVVIRTGGNVGIGTTNPETKLDVIGGDMQLTGGHALYSFGNGDYTNANATWGNFYSSGSATRFLTSGKGTYSASIPDMYFSKFDGSTITNMMFIQSSTGNVAIGATTLNDTFSIGTGGVAAPAGSAGTGHNYTSTYLSTDNYALTNAGYVKSLIATATSSINTLWSGTTGGNIWNANSGNVGIGTSTPAKLLDVNGQSLFRDYQWLYYGTNLSGKFGSSYNITTPGGATDVSMTAINNLYFAPGNTTTPSMVLNSSGNLGVGTNTPVSKLTVVSGSMGSPYTAINALSGAAGNYTSISVGRTSPDVWLGVSGAANNFLTGTAAGDSVLIHSGKLYFGSAVNGAAQLVFDNSGNVGVGTIAPLVKLDVNQGAYGWPVATGTAQTYGALRLRAESGGSVVLDMGVNGASGTWLQTTNRGDLSQEYPLFLNPNGGNVGIGATAISDVFSIGNAGTAAPAGSSATGHNYTSTYLSADNYALANYGLVKTLISAATSTITLWGGTTGGNIWSLNSGNVGIGTTNPVANLDVSGRTSKFSNLQPVYQWYFGGGVASSATWMKIADVSLGTNVYVGTNFKVTIMDAMTNSGGSVSASALTYYVRMTRSGGVQDTPNDAQVSGPSVNYVRVVQTATGVYELQVNQPADWRFITVTAQAYGINSLGAGGAITYATTPAAGSTTGTIYTATAVNSDYFSNLFTLGSVGIGTTTPSAYRLNVVGGDIYGSGNAVLAGTTGLTLSGAGADLNFTGTGPNTITTASGVNLALIPGGTGNVGIGTTVPNDIFSIANAGVAAPAGSSATGHNYTSTYLSADNYALANYGLVKTLISAATSTITLWGGTTGGNIWSLNSGSVGIGTTNPGAKLAVNNSFGAMGAMSSTFFVNAGSLASTTGSELVAGSIGGGSGNGSALGVRLYREAAGTDWTTSGIQLSYDVDNTARAGGYIELSHSGYVGIGTNNPGAKLEVAGGVLLPTAATIQFGTAWNTGTLSFLNGATTAVKIDVPNGKIQNNLGKYLTASSNVGQFGTQDNYALALVTNNIERLRIDTSGNLGIGTTIPNDLFSIANASIAAPAGSSNTGHNYTSTYLSTDNYALTNVGYVNSLISAATSTISTTAKYAGVTVNTYSGNNTGTNGNVPGYDKANALCNADVPGSHVCMSYEILYTISTHGAMPTDSVVWIFNGPPGYTAQANDCDGRSNNTAAALGAVWQTDINKWVNGRGMLTACNNANKFACCK